MDTGIVGRKGWLLTPMDYHHFLLWQQDGYLVPRYVSHMDAWNFGPLSQPLADIRSAALSDVERGGPCFA
jgi:hypothetical protein